MAEFVAAATPATSTCSGLNNPLASIAAKSLLYGEVGGLDERTDDHVGRRTIYDPRGQTIMWGTNYTTDGTTIMWGTSDLAPDPK